MSTLHISIFTARRLNTAILALLASFTLASAHAATLVNGNLSFATQDQSMWSSGEAFQFEFSQFYGLDVNPSPVTVNPSASSGTGWSVDPYFLFDTDFRVGMEVGASINGGSVDANLDYDVTMEAPDRITIGQPFSLSGSATQLGTSSFQSSPANAEAYVDGILDVYFGGYARFVTGGIWLGTHDYRMGNGGFTDDPQSNSNTPYRSLVNVNYTPEIIGINRNESGQLHVLGQNQGGSGSEYTLGATTITAGNWNVAATGQYAGGVLQGADEVTLVTASIDIDQMATQGVPALGTGFAHDWGVIDIDVGYDVVDVRSSLALGLRQDFTVESDVLVQLQFSDNVQIDGVGETNTYVGRLDSIPDITLLTSSVTVIPQYMVEAELNNETDLTFTGSVGTTIIEGHVYAGWDAGIFGSGTAANFSIGPFYENDTPFPLGDIDVFQSQFALGGFNVIDGASFVLSATQAADFDGDGDVDGDDFLAWQGGFGITTGATQSDGDADFDGDVDGDDFLLWQGQFGVGGGAVAGSGAVPEPTSVTLLALLAACATCAVRRRYTVGN